MYECIETVFRTDIHSEERGDFVYLATTLVRENSVPAVVSGYIRYVRETFS